MKKNNLLFKKEAYKIVISSETYHQIIQLLIRDIYAKKGKSRSLRVRYRNEYTIIDQFYLPEVQVIIVKDK